MLIIAAHVKSIFTSGNVSIFLAWTSPAKARKLVIWRVFWIRAVGLGFGINQEVHCSAAKLLQFR